MAEIIIAKHRNGAVGDVLLRFRGEYARFQNPDDDMIVPMPGEEKKAPVLRSKMNNGGGQDRSDGFWLKIFFVLPLISQICINFAHHCLGNYKILLRYEYFL